jgi:acyl carrier protein
MLQILATDHRALEASGMTVRNAIISEFEQVARQQAKKLAPLSDNLVLLDSGLDSLCFAIVVARLEDALGFDPFSSEEEIDFPVTLGDLIRFYENAAR